MKSEELKFFFRDYQIASQTFNKETIKQSLAKYFSNDTIINLCLDIELH